MTPLFLCGEPHLYSPMTEADWPSPAPQPGCPPRLTPTDLASNSPAHQSLRQGLLLRAYPTSCLPGSSQCTPLSARLPPWLCTLEPSSSLTPVALAHIG